MTYPKFPQNRPMNTMELNRLMDTTLKADGCLEYKIEQCGARKKLIGLGEDYRGFAYFTTCIEPAKQAIRTEYMERNRIE